MAGNHSSWWSMASLSHSHQQQSSSTSSSSTNDNSLLLSSIAGSSSSTSLSHNHPHSWNKLLVSGILGGDHEEERNNTIKLENWEHQYQILNINSSSISKNDFKQEVSRTSDNNRLYSHGDDEIFHQDQALLLFGSTPAAPASSWSINSNNNGVYMDFAANHDHVATRVNHNQYQQHQHQFSPESSSTATANGGPCKKARVQSSSSQPPLKVRKEKLGDRITTLHQLVSPFGKTDTASVLLEAIGYIRFLHSQIEALSSPYIKSSSSSTNNLMRCTRQTAETRPRNLRSRGLCLVPLSRTQHVDNNNGALYWPSNIDGGF